jgi:hypothetical protein
MSGKLSQSDEAGRTRERQQIRVQAAFAGLHPIYKNPAHVILHGGR